MINNYNTLSAIAPCDGRYREKCDALSAFFSESALIRYRLTVEIEYFIALRELPLPQLQAFDKTKYAALRRLYEHFQLSDAERIKEIEKTTNHDVKAVEYLLKEKFDALQLSDYKEFIHFGLTSQDVNNTALPMMLRDAHEKVMLPALLHVVALLEERAKMWKSIPMPAHTHGQPASPTNLGKEMYVFVERLKTQIAYFETIPYSAKFGGATGNFNAHHVAYPEIDWIRFSNDFVNNVLGLSRSQTTTQIEHYDNMAARFDNWRRINTILLDFCRDMWSYISMNYFNQTIKEGEVGSSAMPHKVNPIDFENAEGNIGVANALFSHLSEKLPLSRLQRDLTDSTVTRIIGVPMAHTLIALKSLEKGVNKLSVNEIKMSDELNDNWAVVAEAIQTILRRENYPQPYEALKALTRKNEKITQKAISDFIDTLNIDPHLKQTLKNISPHNYTGISPL
ncbi:MAG: adenylosuccinate lyase [Bacteroidales bacterium]|nr:adenylosuccinate lyase [Bacteroidales bacterium]